MMLQKGRMKIDSDIIYQTKKGFETKVIMGEKVVYKI